MNLDCTKLIIETVVALCTVITLFVIWLTLKEMKTQRFKIFEPQIFPINFDFFLSCDYPNKVLPVKCASEKELLKTSENFDIFLKLKNIGQGIAKDISIEVFWNIKFKQSFDMLKTELQKTGVEIDMEISDASCWLESSEAKKIYIGGNYPFEYKAVNKFDYLLPVKDNDEFLKIRIPNSIELLLSLYVLLLEASPDKKKKDIYQSLKECVNVSIKVDYKDNLDKSFWDEFKLMLAIPKIEMSSKYLGKIYTVSFERYNNYNA